MNQYILIISVMLIFISPEPLSIAYSIVVLVWTLNLMWRKNEVKILFIGLAYFWMSTSSFLPYGAFSNQTLQELSESASNQLPFTHFLSVSGLVFFVMGIYFQIKRIKPIPIKNLMQYIKQYDPKKLLIAYIAYSFFTSFAGSIFLSIVGGQLLYGLIQLKWAFLTFIILHTLIFPQNKFWVISFILIEIILSLSGFWASFKDYILVAIAAFLTITPKIDTRTMLSMTLIGVITLTLGIVWSYVKGEYRNYLTGGIRSQQVLQTDTRQNLQKLQEIVNKNFSKTNYKENLDTGFKHLIARISYIEYFAMAVHRVPDVVPYENGQLLKDAWQHITRPRFLFPDKKIIDDSEMTSKYTGRRFAGLGEGASFSLGLVAERYIDFGPVLMFIPIFFFGAWIGFLYRLMIQKSYNPVWGLCFVVPLLFFLPCLGMPTTKFFGWTIYYLLSFLIVNRFVVPILDPWLKKSRLQNS